MRGLHPRSNTSVPNSPDADGSPVRTSSHDMQDETYQGVHTQAPSLQSPPYNALQIQSSFYASILSQSAPSTSFALSLPPLPDTPPIDEHAGFQQLPHSLYTPTDPDATYQLPSPIAFTDGELRDRSRRNEARARNRIHEAESRLRNAIYDRAQKLPKNRQHVYQTAADIIISDTSLLKQFDERITELEALNTTLSRRNESLQSELQDVKGQYHSLQDDYWKMDAVYQAEKRVLLAEVRQMRQNTWPAGPSV